VDAQRSPEIRLQFVCEWHGASRIQAHFQYSSLKVVSKVMSMGMGDQEPRPSQQTFKRNGHINYFLRCLRALPTQAQDNDSNRSVILNCWRIELIVESLLPSSAFLDLIYSAL
jgi:hypothetical protein